MALLVAPDPDDPEADRRIIAPIKHNLARQASSIAYRLTSVDGSDHARVTWEGETRHRLSELLAVYHDDESRDDRADAEEFLLTLLGAGAVPSKKVLSGARGAGIPERTLRRAKRKLGIVAYREGGIGAAGEWYWRLPHETQAAVYTEQVAALADESAETPHHATALPKAAKSEDSGSLSGNPRGDAHTKAANSPESGSLSESPDIAPFPDDETSKAANSPDRMCAGPEAADDDSICPDCNRDVDRDGLCDDCQPRGAKAGGQNELAGSS